MQKERIVYLDVLRALSCFLIVCMHSPMPTGGIGWFNSGLCHFAAAGLVMFFIISGALLLPVEMYTKTFLKKRLSKVVVPTLVFIALHLIIRGFSGEDINWARTILSIPFAVQGHGVLWFMYTLIGLYLISPILSKWLKNATKRELQFYLAIWFVTLCFPGLKLVLDVNDGNTGMLYYFMGYAGYFVLGYYLKQYAADMKLLLWVVLGIIGFIAPAVDKALGYDHQGDIFWYLSIFIAMLAISIYLVVYKLLCSKHYTDNIISNIVKTASNLSFGIYLIHIIVMRYFLWESDVISGINNYIIQTAVVIILTYSISIALAYVISLIPGSEYIIGYRTKLKK